jgi:hypothetical protein
MREKDRAGTIAISHFRPGPLGPWR